MCRYAGNDLTFFSVWWSTSEQRVARLLYRAVMSCDGLSNTSCRAAALHGLQGAMERNVPSIQIPFYCLSTMNGHPFFAV